MLDPCMLDFCRINSLSFFILLEPGMSFFRDSQTLHLGAHVGLTIQIVKHFPGQIYSLPIGKSRCLNVFCPFAINDLYIWNLKNPKFSEKQSDLIELLDSIMLIHQLTWDDCQQLFQGLFSGKEREWIVGAA
jgi:hypothetical protein